MKSSVVQCSPDVDDNNSNKEVIQKTNTVVCNLSKKTNKCCSLYFKVQRVELPWHFFAEANYEKSQLASAIAECRGEFRGLNM